MYFFGIVSLGALGLYQNIIFKRIIFDDLNYNRNTFGFWSLNNWRVYWIHIFARAIILMKKYRYQILILGSTLTYVFDLKTISRISILVVGIYVFFNLVIWF